MNQPDLPFNAERLLSKQQLAEKLGVSSRSIDRWDQEGILPRGLRVTIGARTARYRESVADRWIADGCRGIDG